LTIYGSILQGLLALIAIVGVFLSLIVQRKIECAIEILELMAAEDWGSIPPEKSKRLVDQYFDTYERRFKFAKSPRKMQIAVMSLYTVSAVACFLSLYEMITMVIVQGSLTQYENYSLIITATLTFVVVISVGYLLFETLIPTSGLILRLDRPEEVRSAEYLNEKLSMNPRTVVEKFGLIRITGVESSKRFYVEFCNHLLKVPMKYKAILKSKAYEIVVDSGSLEKNLWSNFEVSKKKFPAIFKGDYWQLWIEIYTLPDAFANFKEVRYVLEAIDMKALAKRVSRSIHVDFIQKAVAYKFPEWKISKDLVIKEGWFWSSQEWPLLTAREPSFIRKLR